MDVGDGITRILRKRKSGFENGMSPKKKKTMSGPERSRKWRKEIKNNHAHRAFETERMKAIRENLTEEQRLRNNEKARERMKTYREKQKNEGISRKAMHKVITRTEGEMLRRKWREEKRKSREGMTNQKKRRINEMRRARYRRKRDEMKTVSERGRSGEVAEAEGSSSFSTAMAKRKAISRAKKTLPQSPKRFSLVVSSLISSATPRKKAELNKIVCSPRAKKKLDMIESLGQNMKTNINSMGRTKKANINRRYMVSSLIKNAKKIGRTSRTYVSKLGFSRKFISKVENLQDNLESRKERKDSMPVEAKNSVESYFERNDMVRPLPQNATKKGVKKVLECSLLTMYGEFQKDHPDVKVSYSKFVSMKPQNILPMSKNKFMACLCEYCVNAELKLEAMQSLKKQLPADVHIPLDKFELSKLTTCPTETKACLDRCCDHCGVGEVDDLLLALTGGDKTVTWQQWERTAYKNAAGKESIRMMKVRKEGKYEAFSRSVKLDLHTFSKHLFDAKWQSRAFSQLTKEVQPNSVVICTDFAENFACQYQDEAQGAHWSYDQVTMHPVVCYYRCPVDTCNMVVEESVLVVSDDHLHDAHAVHHYTSLAVKHLKEKGIGVQNLFQFSDGASSQYKGKTNFVDLAFGPEDFSLNGTYEKHYFGSRHGKGPCDREIGTIKRSVMLAVKARRAEVTHAKSFFDYCDRELKRPKNMTEHSHFVRTVKYVTVGDINRNRPERTNLKAVKGTRKFHQFRSTNNSPAIQIIQSRERSCFCVACMSGGIEECPNRDVTGEWVTNNLHKGVPERDDDRGHGTGLRVRGGRGRGRGVRIRGARGGGTRGRGRGTRGRVSDDEDTNSSDMSSGEDSSCTESGDKSSDTCSDNEVPETDEEVLSPEIPSQSLHMDEVDYDGMNISTSSLDLSNIMQDISLNSLMDILGSTSAGEVTIDVGESLESANSMAHPENYMTSLTTSETRRSPEEGEIASTLLPTAPLPEAQSTEPTVN